MKTYKIHVDSPKTGIYSFEVNGDFEGAAQLIASKTNLFKDVEDKYHITKFELLRDIDTMGEYISDLIDLETRLKERINTEMKRIINKELALVSYSALLRDLSDIVEHTEYRIKRYW